MSTYLVSLKVESDTDEKVHKFAEFLMDAMKVYTKDGGGVENIRIALTKVEEAPVGE